MSSLFKRSILKLKMLKLASEVNALDNIFLSNHFNYVIHNHVDNTYDANNHRINYIKISEICDTGTEQTLHKVDDILKEL